MAFLGPTRVMASSAPCPDAVEMTAVGALKQAVKRRCRTGSTPNLHPFQAGPLSMSERLLKTRSHHLAKYSFT